MLNLDKEIEELEESLARLEKNINDIEFEKNQYHEGIKRAIKKQNIKQKESHGGVDACIDIYHWLLFFVGFYLLE